MGLSRVVEMAKTVLVVGGDAPQVDRLAGQLRGLRWRVQCAAGGAAALDLLEQAAPAAMILHEWLPDLEVNGFGEQVMTTYPEMEVLRVDGRPLGRGTALPWRRELLHVLHAMEAARHPEQLQFARLEPIPIDRGVMPAAVHALGEETGRVRRALTAPIDGMVGESECMRELFELIGLVAPHRATVLIEGETGTGKELVAQAVHRLSPRAAKPIAVLNCAAIPEALLEAELFGHTRGAFTGAVASRMGRIEAAHGGTLFLDEIGEMPLALQAKMLRFLECGELQRIGDNETLRVDVRVVAATHQDLEARATAGTFRLDLYHRLAVFPVSIPALRARREDIPLLSRHILDGLSARPGAGVKYVLQPEALAQLMEHAWPGNVRELGHVLERATILAAGEGMIAAKDIRLQRARAVA